MTTNLPASTEPYPAAVHLGIGHSAIRRPEPRMGTLKLGGCEFFLGFGRVVRVHIVVEDFEKFRH
jgi:hypothetical protein